jgi:peptidoglycan/LPS O-acetylase OafA/YrhL
MTQKKRIEYIDFAKGLAILAIVIFHYLQAYTSGLILNALMIGGTGVHLFFVLSGFGLGLSSQKMDASSFCKRRFLKVLIPYYFVVLVIFAINLIYPLYEGDGLYALGGHLFLYKMFDEAIVGSFGDHFWFISTIVQFYISFPWISHWQHRASSMRRFLLVSFLISLCYWIFISISKLYDQRIFNSFFLQYLWEFNLGIILAKLYTLKGKEFWKQNKMILLATSLLSFLLMALLVFWGGGIGKIFNDPFASLGFLSASAFLYSVSQTKLILVKKGLIFVGKISYELYLVYMLIFLLVKNFLENVMLLDSNAAYSLFLILPLAILISSLVMKPVNLFYQIPMVKEFFDVNKTNTVG